MSGGRAIRKTPVCRTFGEKCVDYLFVIPSCLEHVFETSIKDEDVSVLTHRRVYCTLEKCSAHRRLFSKTALRLLETGSCDSIVHPARRQWIQATDMSPLDSCCKMSITTPAFAYAFGSSTNTTAGPLAKTEGRPRAKTAASCPCCRTHGVRPRSGASACLPRSPITITQRWWSCESMVCVGVGLIGV
jgi:hypothetical protein